MDINCTNKCIHQREGKCGFNELPPDMNGIGYSNETDCPYFRACR